MKSKEEIIVDWQARAIAAEARVKELTKNYADRRRSESALQQTCGKLSSSIEQLQPAADLAQQIGEAWTSVTLQTKRRVRTGCNLSRFSDLLDQAAALAGKKTT
jgi:hypothetical protein